MRAIGYFRESKRRSLAEQSEAFIQFCNDNGFEAAATFLDADRNGENPGFRQLLDFARQQGPRGFLVVVVPDLATLGDGHNDAARRYFQLSTVGVPIVRIATIDGDQISPNLDGTLSMPTATVTSQGLVDVGIVARNVEPGTVVSITFVSPFALVVTVETTPLFGTFESSTASAMMTIPGSLSQAIIRYAQP